MGKAGQVGEPLVFTPDFGCYPRRDKGKLTAIPDQFENAQMNVAVGSSPIWRGGTQVCALHWKCQQHAPLGAVLPQSGVRFIAPALLKYIDHTVCG